MAGVAARKWRGAWCGTWVLLLAGGTERPSTGTLGVGRQPSGRRRRIARQVLECDARQCQASLTAVGAILGRLRRPVRAARDPGARPTTRPSDRAAGSRPPVDVGGHEGELNLRRAPLVTGANHFHQLPGYCANRRPGTPYRSPRRHALASPDPPRRQRPTRRSRSPVTTPAESSGLATGGRAIKSAGRPATPLHCWRVAEAMWEARDQSRTRLVDRYRGTKNPTKSAR